MTLVIILTGGAVIATILAVMLCFFCAYRREKRLLLENIKGYFNAAFVSPDKATPSYFATLVDSAGAILANNVVTALKSTFMGMQSGAARGEKAIEGAIAQDVVSQTNPLAGAVMSSFPALTKLLKKNPALAPLAQIAMERFSKGGGGGNHSTPGAGYQERF